MSSSRQAGLYVKKGNPLNIQGFQDLSRKDVRIVNREKRIRREGPAG
ncbi:substrate-binding domain-containing protein [Bacillus velezensis]